MTAVVVGWRRGSLTSLPSAWRIQQTSATSEDRADDPYGHR